LQLYQGSSLIAETTPQTLTTSWAEYTYTLTATEADSITDYADLHLWIVPTNGFLQSVDCSWIQLEIPDATSTHPAPTSPEVDLKSSPATGVQEIPTFTAVFQTTANGPETTVKAFVQVASDSGFTTLLWDSTAQTITSIGDNTRCDLIDYGGTDLSSDVTYYWRIKFEDTLGTQSDWSATQQFTGVEREWANEDYAFRKELTFPATHVALPADHTISFDIKTGNRKIVATNGYVNEAIQASGGWQIARYGTKTHIVYFGAIDSVQKWATIWGVTIDLITDEIGSPVLLGYTTTTADSHYFPTICIDNDGIIFVFYGCHNTPLKWRKSTVANDFGSLSGDIGGWSSEGEFAGTHLTYPKPFVIPSTNRVYVAVRSGTGADVGNWNTSYFYTDDAGATWSSEVFFLQDSSTDQNRVYCYGFVFDEARERLSIGWSFTRNNQPENNFSAGIWTAYSDFDPAGTHGFDDWYQLGNATKVGTASTTKTSTGIMNDTDVTPMILTDTENQYFPIDMAIDPATGYPIMFYSHQFRGAGAQEPSGFSCNRWNGTAWTSQIRITESVDMRARVARSGFPSTYDRDGNIHSWFARDYRKQNHHLPTADVTDLNVTRSAGTDSFALVDDGIEYCDGDTTYIEGGATLDASFTSTNTVPTEANKIISVTVEIVARRTTTTDGLVRLYLNKSGWSARDESANLTIAAVPSTSGNNYLRYENEWTTNPDTAAAWLAADVNALEFGVAGQATSGTFRISRIVMRVTYQSIADEKRGAVEVVELVSRDNGATWNATPVSENSSVGVPIINTKHHLTGEQLEIVWTSGQDIFYMAGNRPFGKFRRDGNDFRVYKQRNPAVEIDRLIDYPNLNTTRVTVKLPWAVATDTVRGADDLFVYYGNPNESAVALANPDNVLIFDESFETYADGSSINGVNGWTVSNGTGTILQSPTEHTNKTFAGSASLKLARATTGTPVTLKRTFSPALTDVTIELAIWEETGEGLKANSVKIFAPSNDTLSFGLNNGASQIEMWYSYGGTGFGTGTQLTGYLLEGSMWHTYRVHTSNGGTTAEINGIRIVNYNDKTQTSIDELQIVLYGADWRVDYIRIYHEVRDAIIDQTITTGFTDGTISYSSDHSDTYETADGKHENLVKQGTKPIIKVQVDVLVQYGGVSPSTADMSIDVRIANGSTYDSASVIVNKTTTATAVDATGTTISTFFEGEDLYGESEPYSIKVDLWATGADTANSVATITKIVTWYESDEPELQLGTEEVRGWYMDAVLQGAGEDTWTMDANISGVFFHVPQVAPVEYLGAKAFPLSTQIDYASGQTSSTNTPVAYTGYVTGQTLFPVAHKGYINGSALFPVAYTGYVTGRSPFPVGNLTGSVSRIDSPVAWSGHLSQRMIAAAEYLAGLSLKTQNPIDVGLVMQALSATSPAEIAAEFSAQATNPVSYASRLANSGAVPVAFTGYTSRRFTVPVEELLSMVASVFAPIDWPGVITVKCDFPAENLLSGNAPANLPVDSGLIMAPVKASAPVEIGSRVTTSAPLPEEFRSALALPLAFPIESQLTMQAIRATMPAEYGQALEAILSDLPVGAGAGAVANPKSPVEYQGSVAITAPSVFPVGFQGAMASSTALRIGFKSGTGFRADLNVGYRSGVASSTSTPVGYRGSMGYSAAMAVEELLTITGLRAGLPSGFGSGLGAGFAFPVAFRTGIGRAVVLPLEYQGAVALSMPSAFPIENIAGMAGASIINPVDYGLSGGSRIITPTGYRSGQAIRVVSPVEFTGGAVLRMPAKLPIDVKSALAVAADMPTEELAAISQAGKFNVENLVSVTGVGNMPVELLRSMSLSANTIAEWAGAIGAKVSLAVAYKGHVASKILAKVEVGQYVSATTEFPIEALIGANNRLGMPVEFTGLAITALIISNVELLVSTVTDPLLLLPTASGAELLPPKSINKDLLIPGTSGAELLLPDADGHKITGF